MTPNPTTATRTASYAPFCWCACVAIYERLIQEAVSGGGVNRERRGLIQAKAAEGSGRRQFRAVASERERREEPPRLLCLEHEARDKAGKRGRRRQASARRGRRRTREAGPPEHAPTEQPNADRRRLATHARKSTSAEVATTVADWRHRRP